jgi:hypothetical protein
MDRDSCVTFVTFVTISLNQPLTGDDRTRPVTRFVTFVTRFVTRYTIDLIQLVTKVTKVTKVTMFPLPILDWPQV